MLQQERKEKGGGLPDEIKKGEKKKGKTKKRRDLK